MKRKKMELKPALKAGDYKNGDVVIVSGFIQSVEDINTRYGETTVVEIEHDGSTDTVFMNATTCNKLIEAYGEDDRMWLNKPVKVTCETDPTYKKLMLVINPITVEKK